MQTHEIKLVSSVPAVITELTGKQQRILTENNGKTFEQKLYSLLSSIVLVIGNVDILSLSDKPEKENFGRSERDEFFRRLLGCDRKKILTQARLKTYPDPIFSFTYNYVDVNGVKREIVKEEDLSEGFPEKPMYIFDPKLLKNADGRSLSIREILTLKDVLTPASFATYDEVDRHKEMVFDLPICGKKVKLFMVDGYGEGAVSGVKKESRSSHTALLMRRPSIYHGDVPVLLQAGDLDKMHPQDLDTMRAVAKVFEGQLHTETMFENPEANEFSPKEEKHIVTDLLGQMSFFFPAETI